ncbi:MAG: PD-(D/E)XK nuclease family protein, partial [Devosia sp.]
GLKRAALPTPERLPRVSADEAAALEELFDRLEQALMPVTAMLAGETINATALAAGLAEAITGLAAAPGKLPGFDVFTEWANELLALESDATPFAPVNLDAVLSALMADVKVRNTLRRRDDVSIWGSLEARLQNPDLMILAGLNEGIWPGAADPGPWLSRKMRLDIGLEPPERQQGLAAHDFETAMGNREVLIAYALRLGTAPALPSRLVQRLDGFVGTRRAAVLRDKGAMLIAGARALDRAEVTVAAPMPQPKPPASVRPKRLSVTAIETLMRSPYDLYAKHILNLRVIEPLGAMPDARARGSMIHAVFAKFVEQHEVSDKDAVAILKRLAEAEFGGLDSIGEQRDIWLKRFAAAADAFLTYERQRDGRVRKRHAERKGEWTFPDLQGFTLSGVADRLDLMADGTLEIIDFKTGTIPSPKDMRNFDAPQLLLEAAMAGAGAFAGLPPAATSALTYVKIGLGPEAFVTQGFKLRDDQSLAEAADEAARRMQLHVAALLLKDDLALVPRIRPAVNQTWRGAYEHLARTDEWTLVTGGDAP